MAEGRWKPQSSQYFSLGLNAVPPADQSNTLAFLDYFSLFLTLVYEEICEVLRHSDGICRVVVSFVFPPLVDVLLGMELKAV